MASEFDSLMAGMGIKPMKDERGRAAPKKAAPKKVARKPARKPPGSKAAAPNAPAVESGRVEALERGLALLKEEKASAEAKITQLKKKVARVQKELAESEERAQSPGPTVGGVLYEWGFETPDERAELLMMDGWLERVIGADNLIDASEIRAEIAEKFVRMCGDCHPPAGRTPLSVERKRCEVCGGFELDRESRRFLDAALINGRLRIIVVGRETKHHRMVRDRVGDPRLVLTLVPAGAKRDPQQAAVDVAHADAVILWDPESIQPDLIDVYRGAPRVGEIPATSLGAFLAAAAAIIASD